MRDRRIVFYSPNITVMTAAAYKAGAKLLRDFGEVENLQVSQKGPGDFVTNADRRSEKIIFEELQKARPDFSFLMEESGEVKGADKSHRFIIDPLDGTNNFLHGLPHFSISIALEKNGELIAGVIYDPVKDEMFYTERGQGAFMNDRRLRVSGRHQLDKCLVGCGPLSIRRTDDVYVEQVRHISRRVACTRQMGSAALDLAYVAAGRFDIYFEQHLKPWDMAAGILLVREAGGIIRDFSGKTNCMESNQIIACNDRLYPLFNKAMQETVVPNSEK